MLHNLMQTVKLVVTVVCAVQSVTALSTTLNIANRDLAPDGFSRSTILANGVYPSPLLSGNTGENFRINVRNRLQDSTMLRGTTIHWHGFFQAGTNWADGPAMVNQCPIVPNNSFLYNFNVGDQAGTYWYHSHYSTQYCDGLRGPMVIYDRRDPYRRMYDVDDESTIITLSDWYHTVAPAAGRLPNPDSTLINGLGRWSNNGVVDTSVPLSVVSVRRGRRYRMRLVSLACDVNFQFSIDGHNMTIIEADGVLTDPLTVDSIQIFAGQRYSFVLTADQSVGNYWIRARPNKGVNTFTDGVNSAILRYRGAPNAEPTTPEVTSVSPLREFDLHTRNHPGVPGGASSGAVDRAYHLQIGFNAAALEFNLNGVAYHSPSVPVLLQIMSGASNPTDLLPAGSIIDLPGNSVIEMSFSGGGNHPMHLHGHNFDVVRSAGSSDYNYVNPVRRDVVSNGVAGDNVTIRFVTDNPGPWFLHCHIEWHLEAGLAVVLAEDIPNTVSANPVPAAWEQLCPIFNASNPDQF